MIAAVANVAAAIGAQITDFSPSDGMGFAIGALIVMAAVSIVAARTLRTSPALSICTGITLAWGLWWIALGRLTGLPDNAAVGWAAGLAAIIALAAPFAVRDFGYVGRHDPLAPSSLP